MAQNEPARRARNEHSDAFPPRPNFAPLVTNPQREKIFGRFAYVPAPVPDNREAIRIIDGWDRDNIQDVPIPQLKTALGARAPHTIRFHRRAASQLQGMWADWERAGLLNRILSFDGAFVPRFVRGSTSVLSNHAFGGAFDINVPYNPRGARPTSVGQKGCVRELVPIANRWGFFWGGHYRTTRDGMHFEVASLKRPSPPVIG